MSCGICGDHPDDKCPVGECIEELLTAEEQDIDRLEAEVTRLKAGLRRYAQHDEECIWDSNAGIMPCSCGLGAVEDGIA